MLFKRIAKFCTSTVSSQTVLFNGQLTESTDRTDRPTDRPGFYEMRSRKSVNLSVEKNHFFLKINLPVTSG